MQNAVIETLKPYAQHAIPNVVPRSIPNRDDFRQWRADWDRWLAAWRDPQLCQCGGALVRRKGKRGAFRGCSRYPDCRFTCDAPQITNEPREERHARYLNKDEKVQASVDGKAKRAAKRLAKERKAAKGKRLQRPLVEQLPVEGFDYAEWGELWAID